MYIPIPTMHLPLHINNTPIKIDFRIALIAVGIVAIGVEEDLFVVFAVAEVGVWAGEGVAWICEGGGCEECEEDGGES